MGSKVQNLEDVNAKLRREAAGELQSPQNMALVHTNAELRTKLTSGVTMLRKCQDLLQLAHMHAGAQDAAQTGNIPDIDAFAASCVPLGVADQRAFARTYSPQATASEQAGANGPRHSAEYAQPGTPHSPRKDAAAFSFSFSQPPNGEVSPIYCIIRISVHICVQDIVLRTMLLIVLLIRERLCGQHQPHSQRCFLLDILLQLRLSCK